MARNNFGCICDICGYMSQYRKEFSRVSIPTYQVYGNSMQTLDYCPGCYKDLKELLKNHYLKDQS